LSRQREVFSLTRRRCPVDEEAAIPSSVQVLVDDHPDGKECYAAG